MISFKDGFCNSQTENGKLNKCSDNWTIGLWHSLNLRDRNVRKNLFEQRWIILFKYKYFFVWEVQWSWSQVPGSKIFRFAARRPVASTNINIWWMIGFVPVGSTVRYEILRLCSGSVWDPMKHVYRMPDKQTHWQTLEGRATQLLINYGSGALVTQKLSFKQPPIVFINMVCFQMGSFERSFAD